MLLLDRTKARVSNAGGWGDVVAAWLIAAAFFTCLWLV
jgi:hypothetical protein